jgi:hypothetical protein
MSEFNLAKPIGGRPAMWKKLAILVVFGFSSAAYAGTEVIRDYGADQYNNYAPAPLPPPRPVYYAPPPPVNVLIFPAYGYYGPRFGVHRFYGPRFHSRYHYWR